MRKLTVFIFVLAFALLNNVYSQDNKTVTITVTGSGKTQQEALQTALRNAIEQAFGTFISSNTTILNDELVKDEIVSVSNGNIQKYEVLAEVQTQDGKWNNTVKAIISIDKLTSFSESKGIRVDFKGALFAINIKQQELNEKNEVKAIENTCFILKQLAENCFDYEISVGDPIQSRNSKAWEVPINISISPNTNLQNIATYFISTLKGLSMSNEEINSYNDLNKDYYSFFIIPPYDISYSYDTIYKNKKKTKIDKIVKNKISQENIKIALRSKKSIELLNDFLNYFKKTVCNFRVSNDVDHKLGHDFFIGSYGVEESKFKLTDISFYPRKVFHDNEYSLLNIYDYPKSIKSYYKTSHDEYISEIYCKSKYEQPGISFLNLNINKKVIQIKYSDIKSTEELYKISNYKIEYKKNKIVDDLEIFYNNRFGIKVVSE